MIIGITGTNGSGKGTIVEYLKTRGFKHFSVSDTILEPEAVKRGLAPGRAAMRDIANEYRAQGPTKLIEAVYEKARGAIEGKGDVVIEPLHTDAETKYIQSLGGHVIAIDANIWNRYARTQERGKEKDKISLDEFKQQESIEMNSDDADKNNLAAAIAAANYTAQNNGTIAELNAKVEHILGDIKNAATLQ